MADKDWKDMSAVWQEESDVDFTVKKLTQNVRLKAIWMRVGFVLEFSVCIITAILLLYILIFREQDKGEILFLSVMTLFCSLGAYFTWWVRKDVLWNVSGNALDDLRFARSRAVSGLRYANVNLWSVPPASVIVFFVFWSDWERIHSKPFGDYLLAGVIGLLIVTSIWAIWFRRKKVIEIRALDKVIADMESE